MVTTRAMPRGQPGPGDEEARQRLSLGGELLAAGRLLEAREHLEAAHRLQPKNEKAQNLLGLCCFKLGELDRAAEVYELLVRENPVDATLRVNLGLVYLKSGALQRAVRELETATDLAPEHLRAQNYLGLALAQVGEYGRAREHFLLAGSEHMAAKMARAIAGEALPQAEPVVQPPPAPPPHASAVAPPPPAPVVAPDPPVRAAAEPVHLPRLEDSWGAQFGLEQAVQAAQGEAPEAAFPAEPERAPPAAQAGVDPELDFTGMDADDDALPPSPVIPNGEAYAPGAGEDGAAWEDAASVAEPAPGEAAQPWAGAWEDAGAGGGVSAPSGQEALTEGLRRAAGVAPGLASPWDELETEAPLVLGAAPGSRLQRGPSLGGLAEAVQLLAQPPASVFEVREGALCICVHGELLTRLSGLLSVEGEVEFTPERRRQRGRPVDAPFGEGEAQLMRARGEGVLLLHGAGRVFLPVELGEESAYVREEALFALEESVMFENGRMAVEAAPDLALVHLRGAGRVLLELGGPLRSVGVTAGRPVVVPLAHLVGWQGDLSPRGVALGGRVAAGVELTGQGFVLLALPGR